MGENGKIVMSGEAYSSLSAAKKSMYNIHYDGLVGFGIKEVK